MSFYIVAEDTDQILEICDRCPDVQKAADDFKCAVYIIDGQHSGLSATPQEKSTGNA